MCRLRLGEELVLELASFASRAVGTRAAREAGVLNLPGAVRIYLATEPVDMRKGFDGLAALVRRHGGDVFSGHLFAFISRRRNRIVSVQPVIDGRA